MTSPRQIMAVQMEAASGCSRCNRTIPLLGFAFLDEKYAATCGACVADAYNLLSTAIYVAGRDIGPGDVAA